MYDFAMLKGRLQHELEQVASTANWNPAIVCLIEQLLKSYKCMQEIQKMQWDEMQRMKTQQNR